MSMPLKGIRVLDLTSTLMGPFATQILGDLGAEIIKVESPSGDIVRQVGPSRNDGMGALYLNNNRSKKSIQIDLKSEEGRGLLLRLSKNADVLIYNMRPQAMGRLNLGYEAFRKINPRLIYAGVHGFGQDGEYADRPAYDDLIQAGSGLANLFTYRNSNAQPDYVPNAIADRVGALYAVIAILSALWERLLSQQGQEIQIPMYETMVSFVMSDHMGGLTFEPQVGVEGYSRQLSSHRKPYKTKDGYIGVLFYTDGHWSRFFQSIGRFEKFRSDSKYKNMSVRHKHINEIYEELESIFIERTTKEWMEILVSADVPAMPLHNFHDLLNDEHLKSVNFFRIEKHPTEGLIRTMRFPINFSRTPVDYTSLAPVQGEHTAEVLSELGLQISEIEELVNKKIINAN